MKVDASTTKVTVIGEALIDLVPGDSRLTFTAHPGGSPYNVAIGLARLGVDTSLMARLSDNAFGRMLRECAAAEGVDLSAAPLAVEPATLAVVSFDAEARASYEFYLEGTADWQWSESESEQLPAETAILHFGSIASWTPPGGDRIADLARRTHDRGDVLVSYDPNIRPSLLKDSAHARTTVERCVRLAHIAKASTEDVAWLYPDDSVEEVGHRWLDFGSKMVIITGGPGGALAFSESGVRLDHAGIEVTVSDTVGAGDSFTSGLLASFTKRGIRSPHLLSSCKEEDLFGAIDDAIWASAITCERPGADPPKSADIDSERQRST
jgi:fructokinase